MIPSNRKFRSITASLATGLAAAALLATAAPSDSRADGSCVETARTESSLLINDPAVIVSAAADAGGPLHFSTVIQAILPPGADRRAYTDFVTGWLGAFGQSVPAHPIRPIEARPAVREQILEPWLLASRELRATQGRAEDGTLEPSIAPFKLLALVNRMDLRDPSFCAADAGQGRLVYTTLARPTARPTQAGRFDTIVFNAILEFRLPTGPALTSREWARRWLSLGALPCAAGPGGCDAFRSAVIGTVAAFTRRDFLRGSTVARPLLQIRTNDVLTFPGELREFSLDYSQGARPRFIGVPAAQTPDLSFNGTEALTRWVSANRASIRAERHVVPAQLATFTPRIPRRTRWDFPRPADMPEAEHAELRAKLGKNTCNGCHSLEHPLIVAVNGAYHVSPEGEISAYLLGQELPRRKQALCETAAATATSCFNALNPNDPRAFAPSRRH